MKFDDDFQNNVKQIGVFMTVPFVLAVPPVIGWMIGSWLDHYFNTTPVIMYIFLALGFIAGFREFYRIIKKYGDES